MAGELSVQTATSEIVVVTIDNVNRNEIWNGSAFVAKTSLNDTQRAAIALPTTQIVSAAPDSTDLADYVADWPAAITTVGLYFVKFWTGTPDPANYLGLQLYQVGTPGESLTLATPVDGLSIETILKVLVGIMGGESDYDETTRTIQFYARDGAEVVATLILGPTPGNRTSSTLLGE